MYVCIDNGLLLIGLESLLVSRLFINLRLVKRDSQFLQQSLKVFVEDRILDVKLAKNPH